MFDTRIYKNDRGNTLQLIYLHGKRSDGAGEIKDVTEIVFVHQSVDNKIFQVAVWEDGEQADQVLRDYTERRGYKTPGSDTQTVVSDEVIQEEFDIRFGDKEDPPVYDEDVEGYESIN